MEAFNVEESEIQRPEDEEHPDRKKHIRWLTECSPLYDGAGFPGRQTGSEEYIDDDGKEERDEGGAPYSPWKT